MCHISEQERYKIEGYLAIKMSNRAIAKALDKGTLWDYYTPYFYSRQVECMNTSTDFTHFCLNMYYGTQ